MHRTATVDPATGASYPIRSGNDVALLIDAEESFRAIGHAVAAASRSVWVTIAFVAPWFQFPDGMGSIFDVLRDAAARGVDVRIVAWHRDQSVWSESNVLKWHQDGISGLTPEHGRVAIRWDSLPGPACHHQKTWLIDAGLEGQVAFIGGMNLTARALHRRGHRGSDQVHDLYARVRGPSVVDVHHNFVQRWDEASDRNAPRGCFGVGSQDQLDHPSIVPEPSGTTLAQIQRTIPPGRYIDETPAPGALPFLIGQGERSNLEQYLTAITRATSAIYIEDQAVPIVDILDALHGALGRGVRVALVLPAVPTSFIADRRSPFRQELIERLVVLQKDPLFTLTGLAGLEPDTKRHAIYVHSKAMLVDDVWATIGSCNLHEASLRRNTELNIAVWDEGVVTDWRTRLIDEMTGTRAHHLAAEAALVMLHETAVRNTAMGQRAADQWSGLAFEMDAASYGVTSAAALA